MSTDTVRFVLKTDLSFGYNNNNGSYVLNSDGTLAALAKTKNLKNVFLFLANYRVIKSEDQDFNNSWFFHLRYNYKFTNFFRLEGFIQANQNKVLEINQRNLVGVGIRLKLISKDNMKMYFGNSYLYEKESSKLYSESQSGSRNNTYLSFTATFGEANINITNTFYFQPLYTNLKNYTLTEMFRIDVPLINSFKIFILFSYFEDSVTPSGTPQYTANINFGVNYSL